MKKSIFESYFESPQFVDLYATQPENGIDVIIPLLNTNSLWRVNLLSFYREIPIKRLILADGGVTDDTFEISKDFPRVEIIKHLNTSLGYRIRKLIEHVDTQYFIYLHSDVFLPPNWYSAMTKHKKEYDWFECGRKMTVMINVDVNIFSNERALSGSQFGRSDIMKKVASKIDDDYSYRQEDIIFAELLEEAGGKYGKIVDTFHYHQLMDKKGAEVPDYESYSLVRKKNLEVDRMIMDTQLRGFIKYLKPNKKYVINAANAALYELHRAGGLQWSELKDWIQEVNPSWLPHLSLKKFFLRRMVNWAKGLYQRTLTN